MAAVSERERYQLLSELAILLGYTMLLMRELQAARIQVPHLPHIPGRDRIIPPYDPGSCQFLQAVGILMLKLRGLPKTQGILKALWVVRVLPLALLQATIMMTMMTPTSSLGMMILSGFSPCCNRTGFGTLPLWILITGAELTFKPGQPGLEK